jgi:DNA mismatch endonuclease (patch repair protein)
MADIMSASDRRERMRSVKQRDTEPELALRRGLHRLGLRYRLSGGGLPGRPDLVLPRFRVAVFVHGCFWHGHSCRAGRLPTSNADYWAKKIDDNVKRDRRKTRQLRQLGWRVLVVWECELSSAAKRARTSLRVARRITRVL